MTIRIAVFILAASSTVLAQRAVPPARSHHPDIPYQSPTSLGAATYAKVLCSAVFVSGRDAEEAKQNSANILMTEPDRAKPIAAEVDRQAKRVRVTVESITRTAAYYGDQGCVIHPANHDGVHFKPTGNQLYANLMADCASNRAHISSVCAKTSTDTTSATRRIRDSFSGVSFRRSSTRAPASPQRSFISPLGTPASWVPVAP